MAHRRFKDEQGHEWNVWDVIPGETATATGHTLSVPKHLVRGWLAFEGASEKRRLAPIPSDWQDASESILRRWCTEAETVIQVSGGQERR